GPALSWGVPSDSEAVRDVEACRLEGSGRRGGPAPRATFPLSTTRRIQMKDETNQEGAAPETTAIADSPPPPQRETTFSDAALKDLFTYHPPTGDQPGRYVRIREAG